MITIKHIASDAATAEQLANDLRAAGMETTTDLQAGKDHIFIPILSPQAANDAQMQQAILYALDNGHYIIPVLSQKGSLPKIIEHLTPIDFSKNDASTTLIERIKAFGEQPQHVIMKVHTPRVQAANRRIGLVLAFLTLFMCVVGILLVGGGVVQFPREEYNAVDTAVAATISAEIGRAIEPYVPRSTADAAQFSSTLQVVATRYRPFLAATATAIAATPQP